MPTVVKPKEGEKPEWTMSQERALLERIVYHRFNVFMVIVTVITTSMLRSDSLFVLKSALGIGLGISLLFLLSLNKHQKRLNATLNYLVEIPEHPVAILNKILGPDPSKGIVGFTIPLICIICLVLANILIWTFPPSFFD